VSADLSTSRAGGPHQRLDSPATFTTFRPLSVNYYGVGRGPLEAELKRAAPTNVTFLRDLTESQLWWLYDNCTMLVHASYEDFGLTPIEAASSGRPSVVLRAGGFLDTVLSGTTGLFFDTLGPEVMADAIRRCAGTAWDPMRIRAHAEIFSFGSFCRRLRAIVDEEAAA
jgi:glycosyltransferase involved in cell wall biosynthesis